MGVSPFIESIMHIENTGEWFHGTLTSGIEKFKPFTHFGSRDAALECVERHIEDGEAGEKILHKAEIFFEPESVLVLKDWGTPKSIGIAVKIRSQFQFKTDVKSKELFRIFEGVRLDLDKIINQEDSDDIGFKMLSEEFKKLGIKVIKYKNTGEIQCQSDALCIVDPSVITSFSIDNF